MYRLLKLRKLSSCNSQVVSFPVNSNFLTRTCAFCNHNFVLRAPRDGTISLVQSSRMQSTNTKTVMHALSKKKKRKPRKKYAELLEVTEDASSQTKASVSKLSSKHLSLLAEQPDIDLNELFQLKKLKIHSNDKLESKSKQQQGAVLFIPPDMDADRVSAIVLTSAIPASCLQGNSQEESSSNKSFKNNLHENACDRMSQSVVSCSSVESLNNIHPVKHHFIPSPDDMTRDIGVSIDDPVLRSKLLEDLNNSPDQVLLLKGNVLEDQYEFQPDVAEADVEHVDVPIESKKRKCGNRVKKSKDAVVKDLAAKLKRKELELKGRSESLTRGVAAYIDICVSCGFLNRALCTLHFYRSRRRNMSNLPKFIDARPYNTLLQGFSGKGNLNKVKDILRMMEEDKINWTLQTYASAFECVGRLQKSVTHKSLLQNWLESMKNAGWSPNDLMSKTLFVADQREVVLNAIQFVLPCFEPEYTPPDTCYSCELLRELNNPVKKQPYKSPSESVMSREDLLAAAREQLALENCDHIKVKSIEKREDCAETVKYYRDKLSESEVVWREVLTHALRREMEVLRAQHRSFQSQSQLNLYPFLRILDPKIYVDLLMKEIRRLAEGSETFSPTTNQLYRNLGSQIMSRYEIEYKRSMGVLGQIENVYEKYCDWYANPTGPACNPREQWQMLVHENSTGPSMDIEKKQWPNTVLIGVGKFLYGLLLRDVKIDVNIMKPNSENNACLEDLVFDVNLVPMLSPPVPWTYASSGSGGYLMAHADLVRLPYLAFQQKMEMEKCKPNDLYPSLDALNQLGSVPWEVNNPVLDVVIEVFNRGGSTRLDIPQPPTACPQPTPLTSQMTREERVKAFQERIILRRRRAEMYSLWCDSLYRLSLANHFRKRVFWLPHNMDFRGRVYPCPPHLNHLGSDMARSLLQFAQGQPLGPKGLDWLMIHLINLTGLMKREPLEQRLAFAKSILPKILDSADNPLTCQLIIVASNSLAGISLAEGMTATAAAGSLYIKDAGGVVLKRLTVLSGDPETYLSKFPVHQDGSCNGLQHYAALGRDSAGAESVNLAPAVCPQDVYSCVAALVERERSKDAASGVKIAQILDGFVRRKVIKQTVMTTVYGVTRYGARLQIARQLKDIEDFPKEYVWHGSSYLVVKTFDSLREMFTSTKEIQDWFTECARYIAQIRGENVEWITPLGLPVVQPYVRFIRRPDYQNKSQKLNEHFTMDMFEKPNVMKQKNAFPPNFIHSLDSSHMMLTSLFCERAGITFVSVHDCYWTHPSTVDVMNKICREQFVALHSQPILKDLSKFLYEKFGYSGSVENAPPGWQELNTLLKQLPSTGDFDLENVLKSIYFFS
ncbi:DNA-directed RNA polymerase [Gryllus bimaculatus]|nr:DNA-directed RNA polymerase [Gryllus bimaculatus]